MNAPAQGPVWLPFDPEKNLHEMGFLWCDMGFEPEWHLARVIEDDLDGLMVEILDINCAGDQDVHPACAAADLAGKPWMALSAPTVQPGEVDLLEVRIFLPGGASIASAYGQYARAEEVTAAVLAAIKCCDRAEGPVQ